MIRASPTRSAARCSGKPTPSPGTRAASVARIANLGDHLKSGLADTGLGFGVGGVVDGAVHLAEGDSPTKSAGAAVGSAGGGYVGAAAGGGACAAVGAEPLVPVCGALGRAVGGWIGDKVGGAIGSLLG